MTSLINCLDKPRLRIPFRNRARPYSFGDEAINTLWVGNGNDTFDWGDGNDFLGEGADGLEVKLTGRKGKDRFRTLLHVSGFPLVNRYPE